MDHVFVVQHESGQNREDSIKFIGVFSSRPAAESAVLKLKLQTGFLRCPDGFSIDAYELNRVCWAEGFVTK